MREVKDINFIICDDEKLFIENIKSYVECFMMNYDLDYEFYTFSNYGKNFEEIVKKKIGFKVYFLDIKTPNGSGIDASRMIREVYKDWSSVIIIVTSYEEFKNKLLIEERMSIFDYINKLNNCEKNIKETLGKAMLYYDYRPNQLSYEYHGKISRIDYKDIIYIEKEVDSKNSIIKVESGIVKIPKGINEVEKFLDKRFMKVHKSLIVNLDFIKEYDFKENKVTFKNGEETYLISKRYKNELKIRCLQ